MPFWDDAPFEERRTNAIRNRSWLDPAEVQSYSVLDEAAIAQVREEAWPLVRSVDELHDALYSLAFVTAAEAQLHGYATYLRLLVSAGRCCLLDTGAAQFWVAAERLPLLQILYPKAVCEPSLALPPSLLEESWEDDAALREVLRRRLEGLGPVTTEQLVTELGPAAGAGGSRPAGAGDRRICVPRTVLGAAGGAPHSGASGACCSAFIATPSIRTGRASSPCRCSPTCASCSICTRCGCSVCLRGPCSCPLLPMDRACCSAPSRGWMA
jgi:hypothetical protein